MIQKFQYTALCVLIGALAAIIAVRATYQPEQIAGKLEKTTPAQVSEPATTEYGQVAESEDKPVRVPRYAAVEMTDSERDELAAIVYLEAGNQSAAGQQAVAEVVLNRVISSDFPGTVHDVLHQGAGTRVPQFSTIGSIGTAKPTQAQYDAIDAALYGDSVLPADVVFFSRSGENDRVWGKIGDHVFCYAYQWGDAV